MPFLTLHCIAQYYTLLYFMMVHCTVVHYNSMISPEINVVYCMDEKGRLVNTEVSLLMMFILSLGFSLLSQIIMS